MEVVAEGATCSIKQRRERHFSRRAAAVRQRPGTLRASLFLPRQKRVVLTRIRSDFNRVHLARQAIVLPFELTRRA